MVQKVYASNMHVEIPASGIPVAALRVAMGDSSMVYELVPYDEATDKGLLTVELIDDNDQSRGLYRLEAV